jgi:hypothetical protein
VQLSAGNPQAVAVLGNHAYISALHGGLRVVDVSVASAPVEVGSCPIPDIANDVAVLGSYAYVSAGSAGLVVVDVSVPTAPSVAGSCATLGWAGGVDIAGSYAFVAGYYGGLRIVDVSVPALPVEVAWYGWGPAYDVAVVDGYAYVAVVGGPAGMGVLDVSQPDAPTPVGFCVTPGGATGVGLGGGYALVADDEAGVALFELATSAIFRDDFETGQTDAWSLTVP